jgi:hypothetical protein
MLFRSSNQPSSRRRCAFASAHPIIARLAAIVREKNSNSRATWKAAGEYGEFRISDFGFFSRFRSAEETMGGSALPAISLTTAAGP